MISAVLKLKENCMLAPIFAGRQYSPDIVLWAVRWYCKYPLAYRMLEEMFQERGASVDHATIAR
jgi:transposase-like protein